MMGSAWHNACTWPERSAFMALVPEPTPTNDTSRKGTPARISIRLAAKWVEEPTDDTPTLRPARSPRSLYAGTDLRDTPSASCGARPCTTSAR